MLRKKRRMWLLCLLSAALLLVMLGGCGATESVQQESVPERTEAQQSSVPEEMGNEDMVIHTDYGDLHYPESWREYVNIEQKQTENSITVSFETQSGDTTYQLFEVVIGEDTGDVVGTLTDETGTQRNVYLHVEELQADSTMEDSEQTRFYAMQEDLNYLIDNLK